MEASDAGKVDATTTVGPDILTQRGDNGRTGVYSHETILTRANVNGASFGKLYTLPLDGDVFAQPLYVGGYEIGGDTRNVLIVCTQHNSVYAFDADSSGAPLWQVNLGTPIPVTPAGVNPIFANYNVIVGQIGIVSTPVIDRANGLIYLANIDLTGTSTITNRVHVLSLSTGKEMKGSPFVFDPKIAGTVDDGGTLYFDQASQQIRPGLTLLNGLVYVAFGTRTDQTNHHGGIVAYKYDGAAGTLTQTYAWSSTQDVSAFAEAQGGIWQSGQGPMVDSAGNLYVTVANGAATVQNGGTSYGEAFVKLSSELKVVDWFLDSNWDKLNHEDLDVGSGGPVLVPGKNLVVAAGKAGHVYVLDSENLGHMVANNPQDLGFAAVQSFYGSLVVWNGEGTTRLYIWGPDTSLRGFALGASTFSTTSPLSSGDAAVTPVGFTNSVGNLSLSTNGTVAGTGILWANKPESNPNMQRVPGALYAFNPLTLDVLWSSGDTIGSSGTTTLGSFAKFVAPVIANGKVYVPGSTTTLASGVSPGVEMAVYGLTK